MNLLQKLLYTNKPPAPRSAKGSQLLAETSKVFGMNGGSFIWGGDQLTYAEAADRVYKQQVWVHRCIGALGQAVGSVPFRVLQRQRDGKGKPLPDHPLALLLERPNPWTDRSEFMRRLMVQLSLSGSCYWEKVFVTDRVGGTGKSIPRELYSPRPDWINPIPDPTNFIKGYRAEVPGSGKPIIYEPAEIIHFKYLDPTNDYKGLSPLSAAARTVETEDAAIRWNKSVLDNYAVPGGILTVPAQAVIEDERIKLKEEIETEFAGDNRHRPMILWAGMTWEQMAMSQNDMEFLKQRELNKYEICAVFGVPPQIIGAKDDPTYSNYSVARLSFWEDTVIPLLDWIKVKITNQLAIYWGEDIYVEYDISEVPAFREAFEQKVKTAKTLFDMTVPLNEINERLGLGFEEFEHGDVGWIGSTMVPVAGVISVAQPADPTTDPNADPNADPNSDPTNDPPSDTPVDGEDPPEEDVPPGKDAAKARRDQRRGA